MTERKNQVFGDYLNNVLARMKQEGTVKIYKDVLANMQDSEEPEAAPRPRPRLPITR